MLIAYRDYFSAIDVSGETSGWEATAPLSNAQDRRLAVVARRTTVADFGLTFEFDEVKAIQFFALLAHNMTGTPDFTVVLKDGAETPLVTATITDAWLPAIDSQFPRNFYYAFPAPVEGVKIIAFSFTGTSFTDAPQFGRIWAGPVWTPAGKTARRNFRIQTRDDSVVNRSIGSQTYVDYKPRYRQLTCTIPKLSADEAIGTEDGLTQNLQDIAFEVGRGGEVIVIPSQSSNQVIHKAGIYGVFLEPPPVNLIVDAAGNKYETTFDVVESL